MEWRAGPPCSWREPSPHGSACGSCWCTSSPRRSRGHSNRLHRVVEPDLRVADPDGAGTLEAIARELCDEVEIRVLRGNRVDGLAQAAAEEGADAIVLGSRPRGARGRQLRCTLARELEAAQSVPVLIAPPATRKRNGRRLALAEAHSAS